MRLAITHSFCDYDKCQLVIFMYVLLHSAPMVMPLERCWGIVISKQIINSEIRCLFSSYMCWVNISKLFSIFELLVGAQSRLTFSLSRLNAVFDP